MGVLSRGELMPTVMDDPMTDRESKKTTMPVRLGTEALEAAKIAASLKGMSLAEYATEVLREVANRDIDQWSETRAEKSKAAKGVSPDKGKTGYPKQGKARPASEEVGEK
jgi:hypothetical protein